ncbi:RraA-like protein [Glarea lozoyensis ATCC 20868]|uniref:RraA-like protein n=2 Tax=Glarea lozoyensis TaxID=101852 RepID=S3D5I7_GLAL2|nr:RraA-like protein [Glarea lozoyensis ATCC 20868]EHK99887.1 putative protein dlpA [Glarea lozoyensis 74030]EPE33035.1 RraA-like protein [Glarea lozoyensis ATCC 20868]
MATSTSTTSQINALKIYTACDIADALLKLKVPNAGFIADLGLRTASLRTASKNEITIAPASTVLFASKVGKDAAQLPEGNIPSGQHYVDLTQSDSIVILSQPEDQKCAVLGGIMALRMKVLNARGIVVHGRVRDIEELKSTGLPIWSTGTSVVGANAEAKPHAIQVPLNIDGTLINPGDLIFLDAVNGVVAIPQDKVADVIELLPKLVSADDRVKEDVEQGVSVNDAFKRHRG